MAARAKAGRFRVGAIRVRTTLAAVTVVGLSLLVGGLALLTVVERSLREDLQTTAVARADRIGRDVAAGTGAAAVATGDPEEEFAQVLDAGGQVVLSSSNVAGRPPILQLSAGQSREVEEVPFEEGPFLVVAVPSTLSGQPVTVVVGRDLDDVGDAVRAVATPLAWGLPLLLVVVGTIAWRVVGTALRPVEAMREEVETISLKELHRRVPQPSGDDEIGRLALTMNRMLERLDRAQQRQRQFVSDASHELRSPISSIRQYAEVALAHPDRTQLGELAEVVLEENLRLQRIVDDLLLLSRIDEGTLVWDREPVDVDDLVLNEAARLRNLARHSIDVSGVSPARVEGDPERLERMLRNLTDNAARHARGAIALSLRRDDGVAVLRVDDDGPGIPEAQRAQIFERFFRLDDARDRDSGGAGLGLAIVREIATLHDGTVAIAESNLGGARFEVRLPAGHD